jgi:hypothetical protein
MGAPQELAGREKRQDGSEQKSAASRARGDGGGEHMWRAAGSGAGRENKAEGWHLVGARGGAARVKPKEEGGKSH